MDNNTDMLHALQSIAQAVQAARAAPTNPYKFSAYRSSAWSTPAATTTKVGFNAVTYDTNSNFDTTNNRYVAPVSGFYHINAQLGFAAAVNNCYMAIYKNGAEIKRGSQLVATNILGASCSTGVQLAAGDYIEAYLFTSSAQTGTVGSIYTYMDGFLVSTA